MKSKNNVSSVGKHPGVPALMFTLENADADTRHCWQDSEMVGMHFCLQGLTIRLGTLVKVPGYH